MNFLKDVKKADRFFTLSLLSYLLSILVLFIRLFNDFKIV